MKWLALLTVATIALAGGWWRWRRRAERQRSLVFLCQRAGLDFAPLDLFGDTTWLPFPMFGRPQHGTENVVWERQRGTGIRAFDYWYEEPAEDRPVTPRRRLTCAVVPLGASAPRLRIRPRDLDDDMKAVLGLREIELELEEFNRRFAVETEDDRFAIAFIEQRMMEALLALPDGVTVDVNEDVILLSAPELPAEQVLRLYDAAVAIHERIPRSLPSLFPLRPTVGPDEDRWLQGHWTPQPTEGLGA
ncbi:MAG: hypothetical protein WD670_09905, partial [Actinomycetota bacterium]